VIISEDKCIGCGQCVHYCTAGAISLFEVDGKLKARVNEDLCVECYACLRANVCGKGAIKTTKLTWPRILRSIFSNPIAVHRETGIPGRGTEEMKTNDVTNRFKTGEVGFVIDVGRPNVGTTFREVEKITMALARTKLVEFEEESPVTYLMVDKQSGKLRDDVLNERVLSAIIEFKTKVENLGRVLNALKEVSKSVDTVFSVGLITRIEEDFSSPAIAALRELSYEFRPNGKINLGLGRACYEVKGE